MNIACLGWGSLIWDPQDLKIGNAPWSADGPLLPIEFSRISRDDRVTLIIDEAAAPVTVLWNVMAVSDLREAIESLAAREGTDARNIRSLRADELDRRDLIGSSIRTWIKSKGLDAAIWTGLSYSKKTGEKRPPIEMILKHLDGLTGGKRRRAEEYVRRAPKQIQTAYRRAIEARLGWE